MLQDRDALPEEEEDTVREYKAVHEDNFLSSWLREDVEDTEERRRRRRRKMDKETREEGRRGGKREGEKGEEETVVVKRMCVNTFFPVMLLKNSVPWMIGIVAGILEATFRVTPVVYLSVCLRCRRVCLL